VTQCSITSPLMRTTAFSFHNLAHEEQHLGVGDNESPDMSTTGAIPPEVISMIQSQLDAIERSHSVRILFAIESGSRAWGFPSPNSDYDVRFVYVHDAAWYLSIDARRDVIELPIEGDLDINGWDLRKALFLLLKPNPVLLEWLSSPIVYRSDPAVMWRMAELGKRTAHRRPSTYHYLNLADSQFRRFIGKMDEVPLKKYFYALRPALALAWLRAHPDEPVPMALPALRAGLDLPSGLDAFVDDLLARKARTRELGDGPRVPALDTFIQAEILEARKLVQEPPPKSSGLLETANELFRDLVRGAPA